MSASPITSESIKRDGATHINEPKLIVKPFEVPILEYEEFDPSSVLALISAAVSMIAKYHILGWLSLFFSITSIFNNIGKLNHSSSNISNPLQGLMFAILALTTIYTKRFIDPTLV